MSVQDYLAPIPVNCLSYALPTFGAFGADLRLPSPTPNKSNKSIQIYHILINKVEATKNILILLLK